MRLIGESYTETQAYAFQAAADENRSFVAPYDDPLTIAGQGTIGAEILKQLGSEVDKLDAIFVAIGGGGLIAGIAAYVRALKPSIKIIGVEPTGANCMAQSLAAGRRVQLSRVDAFADGVAVKSVGAVRCLRSTFATMTLFRTAVANELLRTDALSVCFSEDWQRLATSDALDNTAPVSVVIA